MLPRRAFRLPPLRMTIRSPPPSLLWATTLRLRSGQALGRPYEVSSNGNCLPSSQARRAVGIWGHPPNPPAGGLRRPAPL